MDVEGGRTQTTGFCERSNANGGEHADWRCWLGRPTLRKRDGGSQRTQPPTNTAPPSTGYPWKPRLHDALLKACKSPGFPRKQAVFRVFLPHCPDGQYLPVVWGNHREPCGCEDLRAAVLGDAVREGAVSLEHFAASTELPTAMTWIAIALASFDTAHPLRGLTQNERTQSITSPSRPGRTLRQSHWRPPMRATRRLTHPLWVLAADGAARVMVG